MNYFKAFYIVLRGVKNPPPPIFENSRTPGINMPDKYACSFLSTLQQNVKQI